MTIYTLTVDIPVRRSAYPVRRTFHFTDIRKRQDVMEYALRRGFKVSTDVEFVVSHSEAIAQIEAEIAEVAA